MSHFWVSIKLDSNRVNGSICSNGSLLLQVLFKWFISLLEIQLFFRFGFPVRVLTLSLYSSERPRIAWWACTGSHFYKSINFKILTIFWKFFQTFDSLSWTRVISDLSADLKFFRQPATLAGIWMKLCHSLNRWFAFLFYKTFSYRVLMKISGYTI